MWPSRILRSCGISGSSLLVLLAAICALPVCSSFAFASGASSSSVSYVWVSNNNWGGSAVQTFCTVPDQCAAVGVSLLNAQAHSASYCLPVRCTTYSGVTCTPDSPPSASGQNTECNFSYSYSGSYGSGSGVDGPWGFSSVPVPAKYGNCQPHQGSVSGLSGPISSPGTDASGCVYVPDPKQVCGSVPGFTKGFVCGVDFSGAWENPPVVQGSGSASCVSGGGTVACVSPGSSSSPACGSVNGDQACAAAMPPDGCVSYSDGSVACIGNSSGPSSGAPTSSGGSPSSASAVLQFGQPSSVASYNTDVFYYSQSSVSSSSSPVFSQPGSGSGSGSGSSGGLGSGSGSGQRGSPGCAGTSAAPCVTSPVPNAANGDCGATGVSCSVASNALPSLNSWSSDSWSGATSAFISSVSSSPVVSAFSAIGSAFPSGGSCPGLVVHSATLRTDLDFGTPVCKIWSDGASSVLSDAMMVVWVLLGFVIFMSA